MTAYPLFNPFPDLPVPLPGKLESVEKLSKLDVVHRSSMFKVQARPGAIRTAVWARGAGFKV